jgi:hypothetical protein
MTFIVRLWLDVQAESSSWEGEVECVSDNSAIQIHAPEELLAFIAAHTTVAPQSLPTGDLLPLKDG